MGPADSHPDHAREGIIHISHAPCTLPLLLLAASTASLSFSTSGRSRRSSNEGGCPHHITCPLPLLSVSTASFFLSPSGCSRRSINEPRESEREAEARSLLAARRTSIPLHSHASSSQCVLFLAQSHSYLVSLDTFHRDVFELLGVVSRALIFGWRAITTTSPSSPSAQP